MKIAIIGGGSALWAFGFSRQFIHSERLAGSSLCLMDIDPVAVERVARAAQICNQRAGRPLAIDRTTDRAPALDGADFVIISISTGGLDTMAVDVELPQEYGIWHTVGDTVGPGGWSRAVRNIPVFDDLAAEMKQRCPQAWCINVSNPLSVLTRVPALKHGIKTVGLCPGMPNQARMLARVAGFEADQEVDFVGTGIDHNSWFTRLSVGPEDVLERLRQQGFHRADGMLPTEVVSVDPMAENSSNRYVFTAWRELGFMSAIGDRHAVENWPWYLLQDSEADIPAGIKRTTIAERRAGLAQRIGHLEAYIDEAGEQDEGAGHGDDPILQIVEALAGYGSFSYCANYGNEGQIAELPAGAVVETRARYDCCGVHPETAPLPSALHPLVAPVVARQEAVIDIALHGNLDELVALVRTDPLCSRLSPGACRQMVARMLQANAAHIQNPRLLEQDKTGGARAGA